jgi:ribose transport system substrate-binding protein
MKQLRFVLSLPNQNSYHREQARSAQETAKELGIEIQVLHAEDDAVTQSQQILETIQSREKHPDAILFEPLTSTGLVRAGEAAIAAGIGWVVLNSDVDYLDRFRSMAKVPAFAVTRDHTEIGRMQGQQFAALLPNGGTVLYLQGPATSAAAAQRVMGLEMTKPANIKIKALRSQWTEADAQKVVSTWLQLSTSRASAFNLVGCQYDGIAMGARKALQAHTEPAERESWLRLPFTGVDGLPSEGQAWVNQGILAATVVAPSTTPTALRMLVRALQSGAQPPERTFLEMKSYPPLDELRKKGSQHAIKK